jgi:hypothetical protein
MAQLTITKNQVSNAGAQLASMRRSLASWLKFRGINDQLGIRPANRAASDLDLANKLHALLSELLPSSQLPNPSSPGAAVALARLALTGEQAVMQANPSAMGSWYTSWPVLIVGGLLLAVTTAIKSAADVAKDSEEKACIRAGACTDYGFWLKAGGVAMLAFVAWQNGGRELVRGVMKKGRS